MARDWTTPDLVSVVRRMTNVVNNPTTEYMYMI